MKNNRTHKNGHLDIKGYFDFAGLYHKNKLENKFLFILITPRDVGKSTSLWNYLIEDYWKKSNYIKQLVYIRNNTSKTENFIHSFNNSFLDLGLKMTYQKIVKFDADNPKRSTEKTIGTVLPLTTSENFKSAISENYEFIFWEEFNEYDNSDAFNWAGLQQQHQYYLNFIDTLKTYERHRTTPFRVVLLGNKVSPQNELLLTLNIDVDNINSDDDQLFIRDVDGFKIRVVIASDKTFNTILGRKKTLANALASFDERADRYLNKGGWLIAPEKSIKAHHIIKEELEAIKNIVVNGNIIELNRWNDNFYLINKTKENINVELETVCFDRKSRLWLEIGALLDEEQIIDHCNFLETTFFNNQLFFANKYVKQFTIFILTMYLDNHYEY